MSRAVCAVAEAIAKQTRAISSLVALLTFGTWRTIAATIDIAFGPGNPVVVAARGKAHVGNTDFSGVAIARPGALKNARIVAAAIAACLGSGSTAAPHHH